jgi:hypothetical protein
MGRRTWRVSLVSVVFVVLAGCAALQSPGTRYAQMDFHQFTAWAIASDDPELARRFGATRAAVCQAAPPASSSLRTSPMTRNRG